MGRRSLRRRWLPALAGITVLLALLVLTGCGAPEAARLVEGWSVKSVADTYDTSSDGKPTPPLYAFDNGRLLYLAAFANTHRVLLWEEATGRSRLLADSVEADAAPELVGDYALWFETFDGNTNIVLRHLKFGVTRRLTSTSSQSLDRCLSADRVVFGREAETPGLDLYTFEFDTVTEKYLDHSAYAAAGPATDGKRLVWMGQVDGRPELMMRDLSTGKTTQLTTGGEYGKYGLRLSGDLLTWIEGSGRTVDVYVLNLKNGHTTHLGSMDNVATSPRRFPRRAVPQTDGRYVVWERSLNDRWQIMVYDSSTGQTLNVSGAAARDFDPRLGDGFVTWERYEVRDAGTLATVMVHDLSRGTTVQISDDAYDAVWPEASGRQVSFWEYDRDGRELIRRLMLATKQ